MAAGATQSWQSDEAVNDLASQPCRLLVKFTLGALDNVDAAFTYSTAADDVFSFAVPPRRASHPVRHVFRNGLELSGDFQLVRYNDDVEIGVWGHLWFGWPDRQDRIYFEGIMVEFRAEVRPDPCPVPTPPTPVPVPWDADSSTLFEPEVPCSNAFSYLFLNNAAIDPNTCAGSFVEYTPPSPPEDTLYDHLANLTPPTWYAVQATTQFYLDGTSPTAYPFVSNIAMLNGPIVLFPRLYLNLYRHDWKMTTGVRSWILQALAIAAEQEVWDYLSSSPYAESKQRCWQSYFALVIKLGYRSREVERLTELLLGAAIVELAFSPSTAEPDWTDIRHQVHASILLPSAIFPTPPPFESPPLSPPTPIAEGTVSLFALGEVQSIRHHVLRYQPGPLARVENVMGGERRERVYRHLERSQSDQMERSETKDGSETNVSSNKMDILQSALETVAARSLTTDYNNLQMTWGMPLTTLQGSWTGTTTPGNTQQEVQRSAQRLIDSSRAHVSRTVERLRSEKLLRETEQTDSSTIDNTGRTESLRGVYRWLNCVYRAQLFQDGVRLMLKFTLPRPAAGFIASHSPDACHVFRRPQSPCALDIASFVDITASNYVELLSRYGIPLRDSLIAPSSTIATAILNCDQTREVQIPSGTQATMAWVTLASAAGISATFNIIVGRQTCTMPSGCQTSAPIPMASEQQSVPVALVGPKLLLSPPAQDSSAAVVVTVEIQCDPTPRAYDEWQMQVYTAIEEGYARQLKEFRGATGQAVSTSPHVNPAVLADIERRELQRSCVAILESLNCEAYALDSPNYLSPPQQILQDFAVADLCVLAQWLDWGTCSYWYAPANSCMPLLNGPDPQTGASASFVQFLEAETATVLVAVRPHASLAALYYLRSGMIWIGSNHLAPINPGDQGLANVLKRAAVEPYRQCPVGKAWEVVIPTSEQILNDGKLPGGICI
jgi:hypothetical protein